MADEIKTSVRQESYELNGEGSTGKVRLNRRGELVGIDQYQQWVFDGRVYLASNVARETAQATEASFSDTAPYFLLDAPSGATVVPLQVTMSFPTLDSSPKDLTVLITLEDAIRYSSGGAALPRQNMRFDEPRTSKCPVYIKSAAITSGAATDDITLFSAQPTHEESSTKGMPTVKWTAREYIAPVLIGPASLVLYAYGSDATAALIQVVWAEFDTTEAIGV